MIKLKDILLEIQNESPEVEGFINITSNSNTENPEYTIKTNQHSYDKLMLALDIASAHVSTDKSLENLYRAFENNTIK